jgi:hypothetical protein
MDSSAGREGSPRPDRTRCRSRYRRYIRTDLIEVPGEVANTGNVMGGRKSARHYFYALAPIIARWRRLKWIEKGGDTIGECNKRLKGAA